MGERLPFSRFSPLLENDLSLKAVPLKVVGKRPRKPLSPIPPHKDEK